MSERRLRKAIAAERSLDGWQMARTQRVERGFYRSQAYELHRFSGAAVAPRAD